MKNPRQLKAISDKEYQQKLLSIRFACEERAQLQARIAEIDKCIDTWARQIRSDEENDAFLQAALGDAAEVALIPLDNIVFNTPPAQESPTK